MATRRRLTPAARRELIVVAAGAAFAEEGFRATSIERIARAAGVTKSVVYDHFTSKEALYATLLRTHAEELLRRGEAAVAAAPAPADAVAAMTEAFFTFVEERPLALRLLFADPMAGEKLARAHRRGQAAATRRIAEVLDLAGQLPAAADRERRLELRAHAIKTALNGLADWWSDHPETSREVLVREASDLLTHGIISV